MSSLFIRTNILTSSNILIKDIGIYIPFGGSNVEIAEPEDILLAKNSNSLMAYLIDDFFAVNSSTLILVDENGDDISQEYALDYLNRINTPTSNSWFGGWT